MDLPHKPAQRKLVADENVVAVPVTDEQLALPDQLVRSATRKIPWSDYHEDRDQRLANLIEAKLRGAELPAPSPEEVMLLPLREALKRSLETTQGSKMVAQPAPRRRRPKKRVSPGPA
jgi:non-homologous end joining protein Ku